MRARRATRDRGLARTHVRRAGHATHPVASRREEEKAEVEEERGKGGEGREEERTAGGRGAPEVVDVQLVHEVTVEEELVDGLLEHPLRLGEVPGHREEHRREELAVSALLRHEVRQDQSTSPHESSRVTN